MRTARTLAYCLFLVATVEIASRVLFAELPVEGERIPGNYASASWRLTWIRRHVKRFATTYALFDVYHPTRGWALKPMLRDVTVFDDKILNTNSKGMRGTTEYDVARRPGTRRLLLLGDSFTFGDEVSDGDTFAARLGEMLPDAEILNFGVHGYAHDQMLLYLADDGVQYHPDVVLLGFIWDDMARNLLSFRDFAKPRFRMSGHGLVLTNTPVPRAEDVLASEPYRLKSLDVLSILYDEAMWKYGSGVAEARQTTIAIFDQMRETAERSGAVFVLAYLPVEAELNPGFPAPEGVEDYLLDYCRSRAIHCVSLRSYVQSRSTPEAITPMGHHWNATGHRIIADGLREYLTSAGLLGDGVARR